MAADELNYKYYIRNKEMPYYGPKYSEDEVRNTLLYYNDKIKYKKLDDNDYAKIIAKLVTSSKIGALFMGRMEYGPRALGNRSIIADVRDKNIHKKMNLEIKKRPVFQPFCPSILIEEKDRLFKKVYFNKHMTCAFELKEEWMEKIPGVAHVDRTSRVQFVSKEANEYFYNILKEVKNIIGVGALINTSFNKHGRTIVNTPKDAIIDFLDTNLGFLYIEGYLVERI